MSGTVAHKVLWKLAGNLAEGATRVDAALGEFPSVVYAGPFEKQIGAILEGVYGNAADLVVRARMAALAIMTTNAMYMDSEKKNIEKIAEVVRLFEPDPKIAEGIIRESMRDLLGVFDSDDAGGSDVTEGPVLGPTNGDADFLTQLTARGDGDPIGIHRAASACDKLGSAVRQCADAARGAAFLAAGAWTDTAGRAAQERLHEGAQAADQLAELCGTAGDRLHEYADRLAEAQVLVDQAREFVPTTNLLVVDNGIVMTPRADGLGPGERQYGHYDLPAETVAQANQDYQTVRDMINNARDSVSPQKDLLGQFADQFSAHGVMFSAFSFVSGLTEELAKHYEAVFIGRGDEPAFNSIMQRLESASLEWKGMPQLAKMSDEVADQLARQADKAFGRALALSALSDAAKITGRAVLVVGIVVDLVAGTPPPKVAVTTTAGWMGGVAGSLLARGWVALIPGGIVGMAAGVGAGWAYDRWLAEDPRVPIINEFWYVPEA